MIKRVHFLLALALALVAGCGKQPPAAALNDAPERIISLAPDITETVYALGLGDQLVGATTWCVYPAAAKTVPRVGGFGQYNFEAIVSLRPDLVLLHHKYDAEKTRLDGLGIPYLETRTEHIADIIDSIVAIGEACGAADAAQTLNKNINERMLSAMNATGITERVLVTFGGDAADLDQILSLIHISEPTRRTIPSRMPSSA